MEVFKIKVDSKLSQVLKQNMFLGHLSMLRRKWKFLCVYSINSWDVFECSWIFYCWCKLRINELQFPPPPLHQMFRKWISGCLELNIELIFFFFFFFFLLLTEALLTEFDPLNCHALIVAFAAMGKRMIYMTVCCCYEVLHLRCWKGKA